MARGSKPGERRGGRKRATPNRRTILTDRILAAAAEHPTASRRQLVDVLMHDPALPTDSRIAIAQRCFPAPRANKPAAIRLAKARPGRESWMTRSAAETAAKAAAEAAANPRGRALLTPINPGALGALFVVVQDVTASPVERRKAAAEAAKLLLPKICGRRGWQYNAVPDEYGFVIAPHIAKEYRDAAMELKRLAGSPSAGVPAIAKEMDRLRARRATIEGALQCPRPEAYFMAGMATIEEMAKRARGLEKYKLEEMAKEAAPLKAYTVEEMAKDDARLDYFSKKRASNLSLTEREDAEEAHRLARFSSYMAGPEVTARQHLSDLAKKDRRSQSGMGNPLSGGERKTLRFLRMLHSRSRSRDAPKEELDENGHHPFRDEPFAEDGNLYPPNSKLRPVPQKRDEDDCEEFSDIPPILNGDPSDPRSTAPNHRRSDP